METTRYKYRREATDVNKEEKQLDVNKEEK